MEREEKTREAIDALRGILSTRGTRHSRIHDDTADENLARLRALEPRGLCGQCEHLKIKMFINDGRKRVQLRCNAEESPLELYQDTPMGEVPVCPKFSSVPAQEVVVK